MKNELKIVDNNIKDKIILLKNKPILLDRDVAEIYGVETKDINRAVKNNPEKFPNGYIIELDKSTKDELVKNFHRFDNLKHSTATIKAFTERGLYMLATILKGERAVKTTIKIIDTFARFKEATGDLNLAANTKEANEKAGFLKRAGITIMDLLTDNLQQDTTTTKTKITLDLGIMKIEREIEKSTNKN